MLEVREVAAMPGCRIGTLGDIIITNFSGAHSLAMLDLLEKAQAALVAEKGKVVSLTIISAQRLSAPSTEFRDRSAALQARFESTLVCSAVVITSTGFAAVIARTFLAAYQLVVSNQKPHQTFRDVSAAVAWLARTAPQTAELAGAVAAIVKFLATP